MPHLIAPVAQEKIAVVLGRIGEAHRFLVQSAREAVRKFAELSEEEWGAAAKRIRVELPMIRPVLVREAEQNHSFAEVVNQCANMERLMGALRWAQGELDSREVEICHPTTSSQKGAGIRDNDLILVDAEGRRACFEIFDVISSTKDGNRKETKDLHSLGVLEAGTDESGKSGTICASPWPDERLFLVVSEEFSRYLMRPTRHGLKDGWFHYRLAGEEGTTRIIEVIEGAERRA